MISSAESIVGRKFAQLFLKRLEKKLKSDKEKRNHVTKSHVLVTKYAK